MNAADRQALLATPLIILIGAAIAWAGSQGGAMVGSLPLFALCGLLSFGINWLVFIHAYAAQTERFFDLTGSLTYLTLVGTALALAGDPGPRALLIGVMVVVWAGRLGSFLFARISRDGSDGRFDKLKPSLPRFFMTWTLQGLWVLLTLACGLAAMTAGRSLPLGGFAVVGSLIWVVGFAIEVIADREKNQFRADPANEGQFIRGGLWSWSRHPNYFGEITLWVGIAVIAFPVLSGLQYATLISPLFVYVLLSRISGVPLLEDRGRKKWGEDLADQDYCERTPVLFPRPPRTS